MAQWEDSFVGSGGTPRPTSGVGEAAGTVAETAQRAVLKAAGLEHHPGVLPALHSQAGQQALPRGGAVHVWPRRSAFLAGLAAQDGLRYAAGKWPPLACQIARGSAEEVQGMRRED